METNQLVTNHSQNCDVLHFVTVLPVRQKTIKSDAVVVAETCIAYGRSKFLNIGRKEGRVRIILLRAADFQSITARGVNSTIRPDRLDQTKEERATAGVRAMLIQLGFKATPV